MNPIRMEMILKTFKTEFVGRGNEEFFNISTDSRVISDRGLFFALRGENFDGHNFVNQAIDNGNIGIVIRKDMLGEVKEKLGKRFQEITIFAVNDTLRSLGDLASTYIKSKKARKIAITGSCGKTTTKELLASMLSMSYKTVKTEGNLNNLIGMPLTAFKIETDTDFAILEMGMNAFGEIKRLAEIACPDVSVITNVKPAHLEGVGSVEGVLHAKWELFENSGTETICIVNLDDPLIADAAGSLKKRKITCSAKSVADVMLNSEPLVKEDHTDVKLKIGREVLSIRLPLVGVHNVENLLIASAAAFACGVPIEEIKEGAEAVNRIKGRMNVIKLNGISVIDDTYNANPASVESALKFLSLYESNQRIAVLADMLELGIESYSLHKKIGKIVAELKNINALVLLGREVSAIKEGALLSGYPEDKIFMVVSHTDAVSVVRKLVRGNTVILIKGSHSMHMEKVVEELRVIL